MINIYNINEVILETFLHQWINELLVVPVRIFLFTRSTDCFKTTTTVCNIVPACSRAAGMAYAGPMPMTSGGTPTTALALRTPRTGSPRASTAALRPISTAAAPSLTWLELPEREGPVSACWDWSGRWPGAADDSPAVVLPSGLKAGRSLASPARVVPALIPSSFTTVTCRSFPSSSTIFVLTGTISCWNRPEICARAALWEQKQDSTHKDCSQSESRWFTVKWFWFIAVSSTEMTYSIKNITFIVPPEKDFFRRVKTKFPRVKSIL